MLINIADTTLPEKTKVQTTPFMYIEGEGKGEVGGDHCLLCLFPDSDLQQVPKPAW